MQGLAVGKLQAPTLKLAWARGHVHCLHASQEMSLFSRALHAITWRLLVLARKELHNGMLMVNDGGTIGRMHKVA